MGSELVSIIMPVFNSEKYLVESIQSVLDQTHSDWELLIVNDGSTDDSEKVALSFQDDRIKYFKQRNRGVSSARSYALERMKGDYFCFLDSDDALSVDSLEYRLRIFRADTTLDFVDGIVVSFDKTMKTKTSEWKPTYTGNPLNELLMLNESCFFGITWMIKKKTSSILHFDREMKFAEDLWFYIQLTLVDHTRYSFTSNPIYLRRTTPGSAMSDMKNLASGYRDLYNRIIGTNRLSQNQKIQLKKKVLSIVVKSSLRRLDFYTAFQFLLSL